MELKQNLRKRSVGMKFRRGVGSKGALRWKWTEQTRRNSLSTENCLRGSSYKISLHHSQVSVNKRAPEGESSSREDTVSGSNKSSGLSDQVLFLSTWLCCRETSYSAHCFQTGIKKYATNKMRVRWKTRSRKMGVPRKEYFVGRATLSLTSVRIN